MFDAATVLIILAAFLLAGMVKGVIGLGLPTVSLALLTVAIDLPSAMALLLVPSFLTNLWQALVGGHLKATVGRSWAGERISLRTTRNKFGRGGRSTAAVPTAKDGHLFAVGTATGDQFL